MVWFEEVLRCVVIKEHDMKAEYILTPEEVSDDLIRIASSKGLCIMEVKK